MLKDKITVSELNDRRKDNMLGHLDIVFTKVADNTIEATMPVDHRTVQPMGLLHGGASVVLAETLGSIAANYMLGDKNEYCVGLEVNANHIKSVRDGRITGITQPLHIGKSTQVWEIKIYDEARSLVCVSRITMAVIKKPIANN